MLDFKAHSQLVVMMMFRRYTIIDAEPPGPMLGGYRSTVAPYRDRIPVPAPSPALPAYPQPYRLNPPTSDAGPQAASPIQYTQYDYNGIGKG